MTLSTIDRSQRTAARVAGLTYLLSMAAVVSGQFLIRPRLIVAGNPAETARNIVENERLFRMYIACNLLYCVGVVVLLTALYVILRPLNPRVALLAAFCGLVYSTVWILITVNFFTALRLLSSPDYLQALGADRLHALTRLYLSGFDAYYVGLLFYGLEVTAWSYLWLKSRYIPRALAAFGVLASAWCVACTFAFIVFPGFAKTVNLWWFDSPMAVFEIATSFWLLFRGLRPSGISGFPAQPVNEPVLT